MMVVLLNLTLYSTNSFPFSLLLSASPSQAEIVKRLSAICAQIIPFLSQEVSAIAARHTEKETATHTSAPSTTNTNISVPAEQLPRCRYSALVLICGVVLLIDTNHILIKITPRECILIKARLIRFSCRFCL